jgi:Fe-S-cluster containining protein
MIRPRRKPSSGGAATAAPAGIPDATLARLDDDLLKVVDARLADGARRAGGRLACRIGCTECCMGPFPINRLDARRLQRGLKDLRTSDPARAAAVLERTRDAVARLAEGFPGEARSGRLSGAEAEEDRYFERTAEIPCPALDPQTGGCDLYAHRPISCRAYGLPMRFGRQDLPPCRLCFVGAPAAEIEKSRVDPDPDEIERLICERAKKAGEPEGETIVAYALLTGDGK